MLSIEQESTRSRYSAVGEGRYGKRSDDCTVQTSKRSEDCKRSDDCTEGASTQASALGCAGIERARGWTELAGPTRVEPARAWGPPTQVHTASPCPPRPPASPRVATGLTQAAAVEAEGQGGVDGGQGHGPRRPAPERSPVGVAAGGLRGGEGRRRQARMALKREGAPAFWATRESWPSLRRCRRPAAVGGAPWDGGGRRGWLVQRWRSKRWPWRRRAGGVQWCGIASAQARHICAQGRAAGGAQPKPPALAPPAQCAGRGK